MTQVNTAPATPAKSKKVENYTEQQAQELGALWDAADKSTPEKQKAVVEQLAQKFGKVSKSIISKLSRMGKYTALTYVSKTGEKPVKKDEQATAISNILQLSENDADSLTKANKSALAKVLTAISHSIPLEVLTPIEEKTRDNIVKALANTFGMEEKEAYSLRNCKLATLQSLYDGVMAFNFVDDVRCEVDQIIDDKLAAIAKEAE